MRERKKQQKKKKNRPKRERERKKERNQVRKSKREKKMKERGKGLREKDWEEASVAILFENTKLGNVSSWWNEDIKSPLQMSRHCHFIV